MLCPVRLCWMLRDTGTARLEPVDAPLRVGNTLFWSVLVRRYCSCAVMLTLVPCCCPRPSRPPAPPNPPRPPPPRPPPPGVFGVKFWLTRRLMLSEDDPFVVA